MSPAPDILCVADPRFSGGTTAALVADVEAFLGLGARVGLMFVTSAFLREGVDRPNPAALGLLDHDGVTPVPAAGTVTAGTVFLHHPMIFFHGVAERAEIRAPRAALIAHQAPFRGDGSLEYDPIAAAARIRRGFGLRPLWAPISGLCRRQLESFAPLIRLTAEDWINVFETADWTPKREVFSGPELVIGRHGRDDPLKWPGSATEIAASLPAGPGRRIRVMGCPRAHLESLGADLSGWEVVPFGAEPVPAFLDGLDVFSYHHHPRWTETFGRTAAEAAMMGRIAIVDPALAATFGDVAIPAPPAEVPALIDRLAADPAAARARGAAARQTALARYGRESVAGRLERLGRDAGTGARVAPSSGLIRTARKLIGLHRRRRAGVE